MIPARAGINDPIGARPAAGLAPPAPPVFNGPMPYRDLTPAELARRAAALDRAIALKQLECDCVDALGHHHLDRADLGWVLSTVAGTAGTLTAVGEGKRYSRNSDRLARLHDELAALRTEREIIESWLDG